jgi:hypothetical protein
MSCWSVHGMWLCRWLYSVGVCSRGVSWDCHSLALSYPSVHKVAVHLLCTCYTPG